MNRPDFAGGCIFPSPHSITPRLVLASIVCCFHDLPPFLGSPIPPVPRFELPYLGSRKVEDRNGQNGNRHYAEQRDLAQHPPVPASLSCRAVGRCHCSGDASRCHSFVQSCRRRLRKEGRDESEKHYRLDSPTETSPWRSWVEPSPSLRDVDLAKYSCNCKFVVESIIVAPVMRCVRFISVSRPAPRVIRWCLRACGADVPMFHAIDWVKRLVVTASLFNFRARRAKTRESRTTHSRTTFFAGLLPPTLHEFAARNTCPHRMHRFLSLPSCWWAGLG
jgi:hypothetical protein